MLDYCQLASWYQKNQCNFIKNTTTFIQEIVIENVIFEIAPFCLGFKELIMFRILFFIMMPIYVMGNSFRLILNPEDVSSVEAFTFHLAIIARDLDICMAMSSVGNALTLQYIIAL